MATTKSFSGTNVFMSRNLVPPELYDTLHDAVKHNGGLVVFCCDPSRNGPNDYHIIASHDHEKFQDLREKGCNLLGPQCVLSCAKEHRSLPKQGFTCCLALDGVKVLASGFEMDEKVKIQKLVNSMGGELHMKASSDISFVVVKNVMAAKYKWALNILKKPIVTINWLHQCWTEHRVVPHELYRVLPFSGLTICVTQIPADERKEMEKIIKQNGGKYSAELTRGCSHLISDVSEGDKYKVAKRWGNIHVVTRKWFEQSVMRRARLSEESYPVQGGFVSSTANLREILAAKHSQDKGLGNLQTPQSSVAGDITFQTFPRTGIADPDLETTISPNSSSAISDAPRQEYPVSAMPPGAEMQSDGCFADDSQTDFNDLYLSDCRISLVGFEASEMRKLVNIVRRGGGSRYMSCNEKLTHIIVGNPSEYEKKEVRALAALGVIHVVRAIWLKDCERQRKEIQVLQKHSAYDLILPTDSVCSMKGSDIGMTLSQEERGSTHQPWVPSNESLGCSNSVLGMSVKKNKDSNSEMNLERDSSLEASARLVQQSLVSSMKYTSKNQHIKPDYSTDNIPSGKPSSIFEGKLFHFSKSFPEDRKSDIVEWVNQGGGEILDDFVKQKIHFIVECHGVVPPSTDASCIYVTSHWLKSCLEDGRLLDVGSHILYSPLPCQIPLPGFRSFIFCVSQYEEKERLLLKNLCKVLGAKFVERLSKKVTHLLCKFSNGPKYEAACKWGIKSVTSEWIYACVKQNGVVGLSPFFPEEVTTQDREAGLCTMSQYPTQAARMVAANDSSQLPSQSQNLRNIKDKVIDDKFDIGKGTGDSTASYKRARLFSDNCQKALYELEEQKNKLNGLEKSTGSITSEDTLKAPLVVPDVAAAIEDILEQTSKIEDFKLPESTGCVRTLSTSECSIMGQKYVDTHSAFVLSKHCLSRTEKKIDTCDPCRDANAGAFDGFSETQTDSQVVGYEEDLSGRQMIIDRVRAQSSMT